MIIYILLLCAIAYSFWAQVNVSGTFSKYSKKPNASGLTGAQAARLILDRNGLGNIAIEHVPGELTDHYDPSAHVLRLSDSTYAQSTSAAVGVAAHEAGHAIQHSVGYAPINIRMAIVPLCNLGSKLAMPLVIIGLAINAYLAFDSGTGFGYTLAMIGVLAYGLAAFFQFITLPVEFNASSRALKIIEQENLLGTEELSDSKKVLKAAALTYVAAFAVSFLQFLRLLSVVRNSRR